jgi:hypothetical protein
LSKRIAFLVGNRRPLDHSYLPLRTKAEWIDRYQFETGSSPSPAFLENLFRIHFPLGLSPEAYFKLCWRIKKFQLEGDAVNGENSGHFAAAVEMVRLPLADDPVAYGTTFKTIAASSETRIIGASKRFYFRDFNAPPLPPGDYDEGLGIDTLQRDIFSNSLRNEGFFMRDPASPSNIDFPFGIGFSGDDDFFFNIYFSLLTGGIAGANPIEFVGNVYDPDTQKVFVQLFLGWNVVGSVALQAAREFTGSDYPRFPFNSFGDADLPSSAGALIITGLEADPVSVGIYRQQAAGGGDVSLNATLTPTEYWP